MKHFKGFATFVHMLSLFGVMCAGFVAFMQLVPNHPMAWGIFFFASITGLVVMVGFFTKSKYWYYNHAQLLEIKRKYDEAYADVFLLKKRYLDKVELSDQLISECNELKKTYEMYKESAETGFNTLGKRIDEFAKLHVPVHEMKNIAVKFAKDFQRNIITADAVNEWFKQNVK